MNSLLLCSFSSSSYAIAVHTFRKICIKCGEARWTSIVLWHCFSCSPSDRLRRLNIVSCLVALERVNLFYDSNVSVLSCSGQKPFKHENENLIKLAKMSFLNFIFGHTDKMNNFGDEYYSRNNCYWCRRCWWVENMFPIKFCGISKSTPKSKYSLQLARTLRNWNSFFMH